MFNRVGPVLAITVGRVACEGKNLHDLHYQAVADGEEGWMAVD